MKNLEKFRAIAGMFLLFIVIAVMMQACIGGCASKCAIHEPDAENFRSKVPSSTLQASFSEGKLVPGMPYFVVQEMFQECGNRRGIPVASVGSRQELKEVEGWNRQSYDPNIKVYMDKYKTEFGELAVWYRFQDFYRMEVKAGDSFYAYWQDSIKSSLIDYLTDRDNVMVQSSLTGIPDDAACFGEIRHLDNPKYNTTYYYELTKVDSITLYLEPADPDYYPIQKIEVNGEPEEFFQWRSAK